jgi:hypothetical protein
MKNHRFTLIAHALLSGVWSTAVNDVVTWTYNFEKRLLRVTRGAVTRFHGFPVDHEPISMRALQEQLPELARNIGKAIEQPA